MLWTLQLSLPMEMVSKFHPNVFWLNVRRDGPQPSICVRTLSPITTNPACARTTFAEPLADLVVPHARRTNRQASRLRAIAKELRGRPAARESENVLMPDREAQTLQAWLTAHPGVEVISRDRAGAYAQGARKGVPQAQQVTDRFHLLLNLQEALKRLFDRKQEALQEEADQQRGFLKPSAPSDDLAEVLPVSPAPLTATALGKQARRARRLGRYEEVMRLHEQGASQV